jgi:hypothetical protein
MVFLKEEENKMKKGFKNSVLAVCALTAIFFLLNACAAKTVKNFWGDPQTGLNLAYRSLEGEGLSYATKIVSSESVDMMGQTMTTDSKASSRFTVKSKGMKEGKLLLGITVDDWKMEANNPMTGKIKPDFKNIIGKSFGMSLSTLGKESGFTGTEKLKYQLGTAGERKIESSFRSIFPDLTEKPVKVGDTWKTVSDVTEKSGPFEITVHTDSVNTLAGLETVNGLACIKVTETITGSLNGKGQQMGADMEISGKITGTSTWYFAYKKGYFVKAVLSSESTGEVNVVAQGMALPLKTKSTIEISVVK